MKSVRFTASSLMREKADVAINWTAVSVILDPADVYQTLMSNKPVLLDALPREHGIYALHDYTGALLGADQQPARGRLRRAKPQILARI
jgi:hypothetical protein